MLEIIAMSNPTEKLEQKELQSELDEIMLMIRVNRNSEVGKMKHRNIRYAIQSLINEARIEELKQLDSLTHSFMSLGTDFIYEYRQSAVDARIKELETPNQVEVMCTACSGSGIGASGDSNSTCIECNGDIAVDIGFKEATNE